MVTPNEAQVVADFARERDLFIISDEIYERIRYDDRAHLSLGNMDGCFDRTITINGFSKTFAMTGWRLGYLAGPSHVINEAVKAQQHTVGCAGSFTQRAGVAALEAPDSVVDAMVEEYDRRRRLVVDGLRSIEGIECLNPDGAFYAFPRISGLGFESSTEFSTWLIQEAGVAVTPGSAFGPGGEGHIRISYANSQQVLGEGIERIADAASKL
jgi:aspartate aminotransferase